MNTLRKINLLIMIIVPLNILSMEVKQTSLSSDSVQANNKNDVMPKGFPVEVKIKILKDMINSAQTVQECDNLFKVLVEINKDLPTKENDNNKQRFFRSALFNEIELKKYKILCDIDKKLKMNGCKKYDVISIGVNARDEYRHTPLHWAAANIKDETITALLIRNGADINAQDTNKWTPMHWAVFSDNYDIVNLLIKNGANINIADGVNDTPLDKARKYRFSKLVALLESKLQDSQTLSSK